MPLTEKWSPRRPDGVIRAARAAMQGRFGRRERAVTAIAAAAIVIVVVGFLYIRPAVVASRVSGAAARPSPTLGPSPWNQPCPPTGLTLSGIFQECASVDIGMSCPAGSFDLARVLRLHGAKHDFILYIEVNGAYRGPGTYVLAPWPHDTLGRPDGVAKVALRDWSSGQFWQSAAGSLTVAGEEAGWLYAGLGASTYSTVDVQINVSGWWSCSQARLPGPRGGASPCLPTAGEPALLDRLTSAGIHVDAASASVSTALFPKAASVCLLDVGSSSFEAAFFNERSSAAAVRVCSSRSGTRYLYVVDGQTVDSSRELYWSVADAFVVWTDSPSLDTSLADSLKATRPRC